MSSAPKSADRSADAQSEWHRGILNPAAEGERFQLVRYMPCVAVAHVVERYWCVRWDLFGDDSYLTETMPYPSVNLVFEAGTATVTGICTRRWSRTLSGSGRAFGVKFLPGAFAAFFARPIHELTDQVLPIERVFGAAGNALANELLAQTDDGERVRMFEAFIAPRLPASDPDRERVTQIVSLSLSTPSLRRVDQLAAAVSLNARSLQRLFRRYLGVTPKWMLCRFRIQEAAQRVAEGSVVDWAGLASELGYFDQAHFASDFKAQIGKTPTEYALLTQPQRG